MGNQSRSSKYLILQLWCGLLTIAVTVMAAVLFSVKLSSTEKGGVSSQNPVNVTPTVSETAMESGAAAGPSSSPDDVTEDVRGGKGFMAPLKTTGAPLSFIQLIMGQGNSSWQIDDEICPCNSSSLFLRNNSIHCSRAGLYFFYAHVTFIGEETSGKKKETSEKRSVTLYRNARGFSKARDVFTSVDPSERGGSVWVAKIIRLKERDSVSLGVSSKYLWDTKSTYWGAYQIQQH